MPLHLSAAHSSRVAKRSPKPPSLRRSASSPFTSFNQRKPIQRSKSKPESSDYDEDLFDERLDDLGIVTTLATRDTPRDVAQIIQYANAHMFEPVPERGGFNSVKIAEILNFRASLPKTVALVHVHALSKSPTATEREISNLTRMNILRKITIPGRGTGGSTIGEGLILLKDLEEINLLLKTRRFPHLHDPTIRLRDPNRNSQHYDNSTNLHPHHLPRPIRFPRRNRRFRRRCRSRRFSRHPPRQFPILDHLNTR
ncbi:MAG: hypothetical protein Q9201_003217 [Fulgogasparrea decipioides]